jgi:lipoprotein-releasing system ATP-binding protein
MLEVRDLSKSYETPAGPLRVFAGVNLSLQQGDSASIVGPSGSGKSTLLFVLGGLEYPTSGTVLLEGETPFDRSANDLASFRNRKVGFVFQDHHLLPQCTVLENVLVPTLVSGDNDGAEERARTLLDRVGLSARIDHRPAELSGGERQRAAIARALIRSPRLLLCDEPTGNLDHESTEGVASLLIEVHRETGAILIVVTHNLELAARFGRHLRLTGNGLEELHGRGDHELGR